MAEYNPAIDYVLVNEGGYTNNPNDPGGATNFGILQREWPGVDIRRITRQQAIEWYLPNYWNKATYTGINSQQVATKLFDMHVNLGLIPAVVIAQHALGFAEPDIDGDMGPMTVKAINAADPTKFLSSVISLLVTHYKALEGKNPKLMVFDRGWMARANKIPPADVPPAAAAKTS